MTPNPGYLPSDAIGKRVFVLLENGMDNRDRDPAAAPGWSAESASWRRTGHPFDIAEYEVV